jgi:hypothetical protein
LTNASRTIVGLDHLHMHRRHIAIAWHYVVVKIRLLDRAVLDADALGQREPNAIDDAALGLRDDIVRLYRNAAVDCTPDIMDFDFAGAAID